ncbi:DUF6090 family protein [Muricauda sp. SCSIO 64092]|uniref:DUF6090 family protein n=1 Tax=Allomuricauda sp. SCSIO 64092 TaxID=2908842 RepID=UPI001FF2A1AA|nr:DUF6090 family protein [Muricauda sp. SCSIO 64092]UOY08550.1 DUF6090 family protein [Muricauda sp. SCSIO 64092]
MIQFFRHIRQTLLAENKFSKYLLYAVGEIVLVVIGILIALQINNWNESRKSDVLRKTYEKSLSEELKADLRQLASLDSMFSAREKTIQDYFDHFNTVTSNLDTLKMKMDQLRTSKNTFNSTAYTIEDLITTGNLALFEKEKKEAILTLRNTHEKNTYYEQITINTLMNKEELFIANTDLAFDLERSLSEHAEVRNWKDDLASRQYRLLHNYLSSTVNLYKAQEIFNERVRKDTEILLALLE